MVASLGEESVGASRDACDIQKPQLILKIRFVKLAAVADFFNVVLQLSHDRHAGRFIPRFAHGVYFLKKVGNLYMLSHMSPTFVRQIATPAAQCKSDG